MSVNRIVRELSAADAGPDGSVELPHPFRSASVVVQLYRVRGDAREVVAPPRLMVDAGRFRVWLPEADPSARYVLIAVG